MRGLTQILDGHAQFWVWLSLILTPILALAGGLGFQLAGLFIGLAGLFIWAADRSDANYLKSGWPAALTIFVGWAWLSTLWSPYDGAFWGGNASILFGLVAALLFVPLVFLRLSRQSKPLLIKLILAIGFAGVLVLIIDSASNYALSLWGDPVNPGQDVNWRLGQAEMSVGRGQISYAQLLWPIAAFLMITVKRGWVLAMLMGFGLAVSAYLNNLMIVIPTLLLSTGIAIIAWKKPQLGLLLAFALAISSLLFAPIIGILSSYVDPDAMQRLPLSWEHRLRMWAYSWDLIQQAPLIGHGFDASRSFDDLTFRAPDGRDILVMSMHPHNIGLQIWLETGVVGVIFASGFLLLLCWSMLKFCATPTTAFAAAGLIAATATNGAATIGIWQHWWWALIVFSASLILLLPKERS